MRSIVHLDADAFFASVEQAADPRLRGKAIAVGGEARGIIASASYEARRCGVFTPMPTGRARRLCPWLIVLPGDFEKYERFSRWMFSYVYDFTPDVEIGSIDEGYFDLTGARQNPATIAETIRRAIRQSLKITVSEGLGANKLVSQIASKLRKPATFLRVPTGEECAFLHPLPTRWLPGIGPKTAARLNAAGLPLIGQLAQTPVDWLSLILGRTAPLIHQFAQGVDERPVIREAPAAKSYGQQETFAADTTDEPFVEATLRHMADELMARVRADNKSIRTLTVKVRYNDMAEDSRSESLAEPTDLEADLYGRLRPLLRQAWRRRVSLRLVALKVSNVYDGYQQLWFPNLAGAPAAEEPAALLTQHDAHRRLALVVDKLRETHGRYVVMRGHDLALRKSDGKKCCHPERSEGSRNRHIPRSFAALRMTNKDVPSKATVRPATDLDSRRPKGLPSSVSGLQSAPPLRVRSYYSFLDSTLSPRAIVDWAVEHHLPAIALTDVGNLHGAVEFVLAAKQAGIKPILGAEWHGQLFFVQNATGYRNLCRLLSRTEGKKGRLEGWKDGRMEEPKSNKAILSAPSPSSSTLPSFHPSPRRRSATSPAICPISWRTPRRWLSSRG